MRIFPAIPFRFRSGFKAALAAGVLLGAISAMAVGQQPGGSAAPEPEAPPPPPAVLQPLIPSAQLAFLKGFAGQPTKVLMKDKQFHALTKEVIPRSFYHYGHNMFLTETMDMALEDSSLPVQIVDGRYVVVSGYSGPYLRGRGFLWFDTQQGVALGAFYFQPTNGEPTPTLTVFSRQLTDTVLTMGQLPAAFQEEVDVWTLAAGIPLVTPRYFIPEDGKKYALLHDEDYCAHPPNTPAPPEDVCEQLNANAAEADMDAAYFMKETGNAADATAYRLLPEQITWIGMRERTCGAGLACRVEITRRRTAVLINRPVQRRR